MKKKMLAIIFILCTSVHAGETITIQDNTNISAWPPTEVNSACYPQLYDVLSLKNSGMSSHIASLFFQTDSRDLGSTMFQSGRIALLRESNALPSFAFGLRSGNQMKEIMRIVNNGNVGIGTTNPESKFHVVIDEGAPTSFIGNFCISGKNNGKVILMGANGSNNVWIQSHGSVPLYINELGNNVIFNKNAGNVGIGTTTPTCKLDVKGNIRAEEIKVEVVDATDIKIKNDAWADYVFKDNYILKPLSEVESFIKENKHLPDVPSAVEIQKEGLNMSEMMSTQMKKIEELTLHLINQNKLISEQNNQMLEMKKTLTDDNNQLKAEVELLKQKMVK
ncbi:MAG: hypothetical protein WC799_25680 [Desulfobacteraceae bacterium]